MEMCKSCQFKKKKKKIVKFSGENSEKVIDIEILIANALGEII